MTTPTTLSTATVATSRIAVDDRVAWPASGRGRRAGAVAVRTRNGLGERGHARPSVPARSRLVGQQRRPRGRSRRRARRSSRTSRTTRTPATAAPCRPAARCVARGAHRVVHRVGAHDRHRARERGLDLAGGLTDGDDRAQPRRVRAQPAEVERLVAPAGDQHDVLEARERARRWRAGWSPSSRRSSARRRARRPAAPGARARRSRRASRRPRRRRRRPSSAAAAAASALATSCGAPDAGTGASTAGRADERRRRRTP